MMKKILFALGIVLMAIMASAQDYTSSEIIKKDTDVFMTVDSFEVTASYFWASLNFNRKDLLNYSFLISEEEEKMWSHLLGMDMAQFTTIWGRQEFEDSAHSDSSYKGVSSYWTGVSPNTNYKLYFAGRDTANKRNHSLGSIDFTTPNIGDSGRSQIKLELSHLSDTMIIVSAYPNENTAKYYTCIVSASIVDSLGMDSLRALIGNRYPQPIYAPIDEWGCSSLLPGTDYYVVAYGQNKDGLCGDYTVQSFKTKGEKTISEDTIILYVSLKDISYQQLQRYTAKMYRADGELMQTANLKDGHIVLVKLPLSDYVIDICNEDGLEVVSQIIYNRKEEVYKEFIQEADSFQWARLSQNFNFGIADGSGKALTSLQFSNVRYDKGVFVCTVPEKGKFYEVALDKSGRTLIGVDKHFESIAYNNQEDNFRVKKNGREFVCDKKGVEIKAN